MTIKEIVIDKLRSLDVCLGDEPELTVRCPYCGDSKTPTHAHLGVFVDLDDDTMPMLWNCLKCGEGGIVDDNLMSDLGIPFTMDEHKGFVEYDRKLRKMANSRQSIIRIAHFKVPPNVSDKKNLLKLQYIIDRLNCQIRPVENKIILSLVDFMAFNNIEQIPGVPPWKIQLLEKYYVGFLSSNNNQIQFRRIIDHPKLRRYDKVVINPLMEDDIATFYSVPQSVDYLYTDPIELHIAEGTFDILSVRFNLDPNPNALRLFYAACGFSYLNILRYVVRAGICTGIQMHIYADKDKTDRDHRRILSNPITAFADHVYLHRNAFPHEKDYGVPIDQIKDSYRKLW